MLKSPMKLELRTTKKPKQKRAWNLDRYMGPWEGLLPDVCCREGYAQLSSLFWIVSSVFFPFSQTFFHCVCLTSYVQGRIPDPDLANESLHHPCNRDWSRVGEVSFRMFVGKFWKGALSLGMAKLMDVCLKLSVSAWGD